MSQLPRSTEKTMLEMVAEQLAKPTPVAPTLGLSTRERAQLMLVILRQRGALEVPQVTLASLCQKLATEEHRQHLMPSQIQWLTAEWLKLSLPSENVVVTTQPSTT